MSVRRKTAGRVARPRKCVKCGGGIPDSKPVFLLTGLKPSLVGPYHAGCAWIVTEEAKRAEQAAAKAVSEMVKADLRAREETLPW